MAFDEVFDKADEKLLKLHQEHLGTHLNEQKIGKNPFRSMAIMFNENEGMHGLALASTNSYGVPSNSG